MNKKRKLGIYILVSPFALLIISFVLTFLANSVFSVPTTTSGGVTFNIVNIILAITSLISVLGIIIFPILAVIGIVLIVKNKNENTVESPVMDSNPQMSNNPTPVESTSQVQQQDASTGDNPPVSI